MKRGEVLPDKLLCQVIHLLRTTDMPMNAIAERCQLSGSTIVSINAKHKVRDYAGKRATWIMFESPVP